MSGYYTLGLVCKFRFIFYFYVIEVRKTKLIILEDSFTRFVSILCIYCEKTRQHVTNKYTKIYILFRSSEASS